MPIHLIRSRLKGNVLKIAAKVFLSFIDEKVFILEILV